MKPSPSSAEPRENTLTLPAVKDSLEKFRSFIMDRAGAVSLEAGFLSRVDLVQEELLLNVVSYAYDPDQSGNIMVHCRADRDTLTIEIRDKGRPFNPLEQPEPDTSRDLEHRAVGGLGIMLSHHMADSLEYSRHKNGDNVLTAVLKP